MSCFSVTPSRAVPFKSGSYWVMRSSGSGFYPLLSQRPPARKPPICPRNATSRALSWYCLLPVFIGHFAIFQHQHAADVLAFQVILKIVNLTLHLIAGIGERFFCGQQRRCVAVAEHIARVVAVVIAKAHHAIGPAPVSMVCASGSLASKGVGQVVRSVPLQAAMTAGESRLLTTSAASSVRFVLIFIFISFGSGRTSV